MNARHRYTEASPDYDRDKLVNAILYLLKKADDPSLGKTKLMKLLYFADFDHYERHQHPITGATYYRFDQGPVPKAALDLLKSLERRQHVSLSSEKVGPRIRKRYRALAEPQLDVFSQEELETLDQVIERWATGRSADIVAATHEEAPWLAVANKREIPYFLALYRNNYGEMDLADDELN